MEPSRSFEDLIVWQKAHALVLDVYRLTVCFPREELFGLTSQMRRSAASVPANIAEGFERSGKGDKLRFYNTAQGSLEETRYHLILARDLDYAEVAQHLCLVEEVSRMLEAYMQSLRRSRWGRKYSPFHWLLTTGYWLLS